MVTGNAKIAMAQLVGWTPIPLVDLETQPVSKDLPYDSSCAASARIMLNQREMVSFCLTPGTSMLAT